MTFPAPHRAKLQGTTPIEHLSGEITRRTDVVGAILMEQTEEWTVVRRYMWLETLARVTDNPDIRLPAVAF